MIVHILNAAQYRAITEQAPPPSPVDAALYTRHGLPWFELYDDLLADVPPSDALQGATTIAERDVERGVVTEHHHRLVNRLDAPVVAVERRVGVAHYLRRDTRVIARGVAQVTRAGVFLHNLFGPETGTTSKESELCVPAALVP